MYPESVHVDAIYRNQKNRGFCKKHGIRMSGHKLGRPPKPMPENEAEFRALAVQARQDELDRIRVAGKFGEDKRRYGLGRAMTKLACTSETGIMLTFLVMNLKKMAGRHFFAPVFWGGHGKQWAIWDKHGRPRAFWSRRGRRRDGKNRTPPEPGTIPAPCFFRILTFSGSPTYRALHRYFLFRVLGGIPQALVGMVGPLRTSLPNFKSGYGEEAALGVHFNVAALDSFTVRRRFPCPDRYGFLKSCAKRPGKKPCPLFPLPYFLGKAPGLGPVAGGPAKIWALTIQAVEASPSTTRFVSR